MKNNRLNVWEILGSDQNRKRSEQKTQKNQEPDVPDSFFHDAIKQALDKENTGVNGHNAPDAILQELEEMQGVRKPSQRAKTQGKLLGYIRQDGRALIICAAAVLLAVLLVFNLIFHVSRVAGESMEPAFYPNDRVMILHFGKTFERGDVVVFKAKNGEKLIKRIVAVEGDTINISSAGGLFINGEAVEETNIYTVTAVTDTSVQYPLTVGRDEFFVLGDNRTNSRDSRESDIGMISRDDIVGRVILVIRSE